MGGFFQLQFINVDRLETGLSLWRDSNAGHLKFGLFFRFKIMPTIRLLDFNANYLTLSHSRAEDYGGALKDLLYRYH